jgi:hypothetical protein
MSINDAKKCLDKGDGDGLIKILIFGYMMVGCISICSSLISNKKYSYAAYVLMGKAYYLGKKFLLSEKSFLHGLDLDKNQILAFQGLLSLRQLIFNCILEKDSVSFFELMDKTAWDVEYSRKQDIYYPSSERFYQYLEAKEGNKLTLNEVKQDIKDFIVRTVCTFVTLINLPIDLPQKIKNISDYGEFLIKSRQFFFIHLIYVCFIW